ncbi:MAG: 30S ribosomal protein S12 methylthiotransferase RimO, partial [Gemmatimonadaceae bacterium]
EKVARARDVVPDVAVRTTCIVGFPGETEDDFARLLDFLEEVRFERVGGFTYSAQEGTRAAQLPDDVPEAVKLDRLERLTELQRAITADRYERHLGRTVRVLVDRPGDELGEVQARTVWQADDVDGITRVRGEAPPGAFAEVSLDEVVDDYDFAGRLLRVVEPAPAPRAGRALPVVAGISNGSFGR